MEIELMKFPPLDEENIVEVEKVYCDLLNVYRKTSDLRPEAVDWMDTANNWLSTTKG